MRPMSDDQRKAMFAKMRTRTFSFPLRGQGGRARRNRGTLQALGVGAAGLAVAYSAYRGYPGLSRALFRPQYVTSKTAKGMAFVSRRPARGIENLYARIPGLNRIYGWIKPGRKRWVENVHSFHIPVAGKYVAHAPRRVRQYVDTPTELPGVPLIGRVQAQWQRWARQRLAPRLENLSLWKMFGTRGEMLRVVEDGSRMTKALIGKTLARVRNRLVTGRMAHVTIPKAPGITLPPLTAPPRDALKRLYPRLSPTAAAARYQADLKAGLVRKTTSETGVLYRRASPTERLTRRLFTPLDRQLRRADIATTKWIRRQARRAGIPVSGAK